ncbi:hypothetical protein HID58_054169 [Brassica napus]|uniref:Glutaredoxin domain-containing protein n=1 Tax=Brassica napus TaxID=3708 RepID=A0ABQ8AGS8_BRANA|nr:hypothetical protein HID58_054169 [Brassica napus]
MSHAIKRLFYEQGVSPAIVEIDQNMYGKDIEWALARLGCSPTVPAVFVGGKFVGTANTVMTLHLNGSLKRLLKEAGVSPAIVEIDQYMYGKDIERALARLGCSPQVPVVFIGGKLIGTATTVMTLHLDGSLKRLLKEAGALWL